jgi:hypothetical protein
LIVVGIFGLFGIASRPKQERLLLAALIAYHFAYISHVGGDWMPFHRFLVPVLPFTAVLFFWGVFETWQLARRIAKRKEVLGKWLILAPVSCALLASAGYVARLQDGHSIDTPQEWQERELRIIVGRHTHGLVVARHLFQWMTRKPGESLATDYGGVFAYYTDASIIEMWGLCNADIALRGDDDDVNAIYGKTCVECYREFQPDYFHANVPLIRPIDALKSHAEVINGIFQGNTIGRVLDFSHRYVTGRVVDRKRGLAFYFLERKRDGLSFATRYPAPGILVEYPFLTDPS